MHTARTKRSYANSGRLTEIKLNFQHSWLQKGGYYRVPNTAISQKIRQLPQYCKKKSAKIPQHFNTESKIDVMPKLLLCLLRLEQITRKNLLGNFRFQPVSETIGNWRRLEKRRRTWRINFSTLQNAKTKTASSRFGEFSNTVIRDSNYQNSARKSVQYKMQCQSPLQNWVDFGQWWLRLDWMNRMTTGLRKVENLLQT